MRRYTLEIGGREYVIDVQELTADSFDVVVGDQTYTVTLTGDEDLAEAAVTPGVEPPGSHGALAVTPRAAPAAATAAAGAVPKTAPAHAAGFAAAAGRATVAREQSAGGSAALNAPMPGVIIEIDVKVGDKVTRGQLVAILDAMKMHNHIRSPRAGTIREVCVDAGQAVGHGDAIVRFEES